MFQFLLGLMAEYLRLIAASSLDQLLRLAVVLLQLLLVVIQLLKTRGKGRQPPAAQSRSGTGAADS